MAELRTVRVEAQVYEDDLSFLPAKTNTLPKAARLPISATTPADPGEVFAGTLSFLYPHLDERTRTRAARFELDNAAGRLRPGTTATVTLSVSPERLAAKAGLSSRYHVNAGQVLAGIKAVRSSSEFNFSMITLIFDDSTGFYFARQRVLERLTQAPSFLPAGVVPYLAPDATALARSGRPSAATHTLAGVVHSATEAKREELWRDRVYAVN